MGWGAKGPATSWKKAGDFGDPRGCSPGPLAHPRGIARVRVDSERRLGLLPVGPRPGEARGCGNSASPTPSRPARSSSSGRPASLSGCPGLGAPTPAAPLLPAAGAALPAAGAARAARPLRCAPGAGPLGLGPRCAPGFLRSSAPRFSPATSPRARSSEGGRGDAARRGAGSAGGGAGAREPAQPGEGRRLAGRAAPPSGPFIPPPSFPSSSPLSLFPLPFLSPHLPCFHPHAPRPLLFFSLLCPAPSASPAPLSPRPPHAPSSFPFSLVVSCLVRPGCLGLWVPVLCHKDFPRGFSPSSPADLLLSLFSITFFSPRRSPGPLAGWMEGASLPPLCSPPRGSPPCPAPPPCLHTPPCLLTPGSF